MSEPFMFTIPEHYTDEQVLDYYHPSQKEFKCIPVERRSQALSEAAVAFHGGNLQFVPLHVQTAEMQMVAILQFAGYIALMYPHFITAEIANIAVSSNIRYIRFVPKSLQTPEILAMLEGCDDPTNHKFCDLSPIDSDPCSYCY